MEETSAGAIIYTLIDNQIRYLLIRDFNGNYGFPKGHLEQGETLEQAAIREIKEETGIDIKLDTSFKEELNYVMPNGKNKTSVYFVGYYEDQKPVKQLEEVEEIFLLSYNEALKIINFQNMKDAFAKADAYIRKSL